MGCKQTKVHLSPLEANELKDNVLRSEVSGKVQYQPECQSKASNKIDDQFDHESEPSDKGVDRVDRKSEMSVKIESRRSSTSALDASFDLTPLDKEGFSATICEERQRAIDNMTYQNTIDQWRPSTIDKLAKLIEKLAPKENQIDRAWIIYYWISQNIRYDTDAYFGNKIGTQRPQNVFESRQAVCSGYASLYADLCNRTGIPCEKVSGYAKGFSFDTRQTKFDKTNHAWNIITLEEGHSYFVESTWGSGHQSSSSHQYKQELNTHYFLCRPEHMIYDHLPEDNEKQLLTRPITMQQYLMLPRVYSKFFVHELHVVSPVYSAKVNLIEGNPYGLVLIRASSGNVELSGSIEDEDGTKIKGGSLVYLDKKDRTLWQCRFAPPESGKYNIFIYVKSSTNANQTSSKCAVKFSFDIDHLPHPSISYPRIWSTFFDYDLDIIKPKNSRYIEWPSNENTSYSEILLHSPDNIYISADMKNTIKDTRVNNSTLVNFDYSRKLWQCLLSPSSAEVPFELILFAKSTKEKKSHCAVQFDLRPIPKNSLKQCMTFPVTYRIFNESKCHLMEPLNGVLQRNSKTHFRCRIPGAQVVNITIDGNSIKGDGLKPDENSVFEGDIQVGKIEVAIRVKFNDTDRSYKGLLKYTVD